MYAEPSSSHPPVANLGLTGILSVSDSVALFHPYLGLPWVSQILTFRIPSLLDGWMSIRDSLSEV
jgi:hypothetical protein